VAAPRVEKSYVRSRPLLEGVTFVVTTGRGSMDHYAQKLAEWLPVRTLELYAFARSGNLFGEPLLSTAAARQLARDVALVRRLRRVEGLLHIPNHHLSRYGPFLGGPYVVTAHDVIRYLDLTRDEPLIHAPNRRDRLYIALDVAGIRRADAVIVPSHATRHDLVRHLGIREDRIAVVYEGVDHAVFRPTDRRLLPDPYILFVGSEHPRKNLPSLFRAVARLKRDPALRDLRLVKIGAPGGREAPFREQTLEALRTSGLAAEDVIFIGHRRAEDLAAYYAGAECLVFPSLYEGFGLPTVEAMASGCPVIVSSVGSLPEIAGDAALVVPPSDDAALADAIASVVGDEALARGLRRRGLARAREFSWARAARETVAVYERLL
jgi:glycosyltransferase involved in cell wall biosynthesis